LSYGPGSSIGPYEVVAPIGAGGMGAVLRARDTKLGREVAIKVLPAAFAQDAERVARFRREAQILASLNHANIAAIHGLEESEGVLALVMELVEGEDLAQRLKRGSVPVDEAIAIAKQIAEALEEAHEKGIVHRDLKPANVKVTSDGKVKVLDFGLAKAFAADPASTSGAHDLSQSPTLATAAGTQAGVILGTAAYMSPEQARGKAVDKRADIWAFGVVLFEMLSGQRLFGGETVSDTLAAVLREELPWSALPGDVPDPVARLLRRCLTRDPKQRLRDVGEARVVLADPGAATASPPAPEAAPPPAPRRRGWTALALVACFAAGFAVGSRFAEPAAAPAGEAGLQITPLTNSGNVIAAAVSPDGRYVAYVESEQGLQSLWLRQVATKQTLRLIPDRSVAYWGMTFTPDGDNIVFGQKAPGDARGALYTISTLGGTPRRLLEDMDSPPSFSPDGRRFTFTRLRHPSPEETSLMVAAADGSNPTVLARFRRPEAVAGIFFGGAAWSPDGRTIATAVQHIAGSGAEGRARLVGVDVESGAVSTLADPGWLVAAQCGWLPDGRSLLVIARSAAQDLTQVWSVDYPSGAARPVTADLDDHRIISLTRDGRSLVSVAGQLAAAVWTMPLSGAGSPVRLSRSNVEGTDGLAWTPDGKLVYTSYLGNSLGLWRADPATGERDPVVTADRNEQLGYPVTLRDGTLFHVARTTSGTEVRAIREGASRVVAEGVRFSSIAVTPDGSTVVYGATVGGLPRVFRVATAGGPPVQISEDPGFLPAIDAQGRRVAFYRVDAMGRFRLTVIPIEGGAPLADLEADPSSANSHLTLRDEGLYVNTVPGDRANVWLLPLDGRPARRITNFGDQMLFQFAISPDGKTLAVSRGPRTRDAQLITGFASGGAE
jgi:Tol biopolymer transport system component